MAASDCEFCGQASVRIVLGLTREGEKSLTLTDAFLPDIWLRALQSFCPGYTWVINARLIASMPKRGRIRRALDHAMLAVARRKSILVDGQRHSRRVTCMPKHQYDIAQVVS